VTEIVPEDELGFYSRREQLDDGRWVMRWWSAVD
jgi:hypothetical protein